MNQQQEWNITARGDMCGKCERQFADKEAFFSTLTFGADGYAREDICEGCWDEGAREKSLSVWKTVFRLPPPPAPEALQKESAESLLRKLMESEDYSRLNTIYILAVMLERKRILAEREVQVPPEGFKVRVYEHKRTGETFLIKDPGLRLSELEEVQKEVIAMLGGGEKEEDEPAPPPAS